MIGQRDLMVSGAFAEGLLGVDSFQGRERHTWTATFTGTSPTWVRVRFNPGGPSWYGNILLDNISLH